MPPTLHSKILEHVNDPNYQPVKPAVIAKQLGLAGEATQELKKTIKRMVKAGELSWGPSHLVQSASKATPHKHPGEPASAGGHGQEIIRRKQKQKPKTPADSRHFTGTFRRAGGGFGF